MKKLLLLILLGGIAGFIYLPYETTSRYATAIVNRDGKAVAEMTDMVSYRESLKENLRPVVAEYLREKYPTQPQSEILRGVILFEKQLDLSITPSAFDKSPSMPRLAVTTDKYELISRGWRSPLVFVAVDNEAATKLVFEFQGIAGWKAVRLEASREAMRKELQRQLKVSRL